HALLDRPRALGIEADQEARAVDQIEDGQVERLRGVDEALDLLAGVGRPRAAVEERVAGHDGDRPAVQAREPGDDRAAVERRDLEERAGVHDGLDDRPHLVRLADVARDRADVGDDPLPAADARDVGAAGRLDGLHRAAATRALDQADQRQPQLVGHRLALQVLFLDGGVGRAAAHREVVAADDDRAPVHFCAAEDEVRRRERLEVVGRVVGGLAGDLADLVEGAGIDELGDALADGHPAARVLALHALRAAELLGEALAAPQLVHLRLPGHRGVDLTTAAGAVDGMASPPATRAPRRARRSRPTPAPGIAAPPADPRT